jgi:hypothetical protein
VNIAFTPYFFSVSLTFNRIRLYKFKSQVSLNLILLEAGRVLRIIRSNWMPFVALAVLTLQLLKVVSSKRTHILRQNVLMQAPSFLLRKLIQEDKRLKIPGRNQR